MRLQKRRLGNPHLFKLQLRNPKLYCPQRKSKRFSQVRLRGSKTDSNSNKQLLPKAKKINKRTNHLIKMIHRRIAHTTKTSRIYLKKCKILLRIWKTASSTCSKRRKKRQKRSRKCRQGRARGQLRRVSLITLRRQPPASKGTSVSAPDKVLKTCKKLRARSNFTKAKIQFCWPMQRIIWQIRLR